MASKYPLLTEQPQRVGLVERTVEDTQRQAYANLLEDRDAAAARQARIAGRTLGIPGAAIEADLPGFQNEVEANRNFELLGSDPRLARFVANADNAAAIKDDLPSLAQMSAILKVADDKTDPTGRNFTNYMKQRLGHSTGLSSFGVRPNWRQVFGAEPQGDGSTISASPESGPIDPTPGNVARGLGAGTVGATAEGILGAIDVVAENIGLGRALHSTDWYRREAFQAYQNQEAQNLDYKPIGKVAGIDINPGRWAFSATTSLGQLGIAALSGNPVAAFGVVAGGQEYRQLRNRGASVKEATGASILYGGIEAGTEAIELNWLFGKFGKKATGKFVGGLLLREIPGELTATTGENLIDAMATGGVGWEEYKKQLPQDLFDTAASTALVTGGFGTAHYLRNRLSREVRDMDDVERAGAGAMFLDNLMKTAETSKVRKEDPDTLHDFITQRTEDSPVRNVYLPVEDAVAYMQSENYDGSLDRYAEQIKQAQPTQGDVVIPVADAVANLSGTQAWEALKDSVRIEPGGLSQKEASTKRDEIMATLEARGKEIASEAKDDETTSGPAAEVYAEVKNRLRIAGVDDRQADNIAQLYAARYEARATRRGGTAMDQFKAAKISFPGEQEGRAPGREVAQRGPLEGMPTEVKVGDKIVSFGPFDKARKVAEQFMKKQGLEHNPPRVYARVDRQRAERIAQAFDEMPHNPNDPETKAAYKALIKETVAQYKALLDTGLKVEFIEGADPYEGNPRRAMLDVTENNHLWVYPTDAGFGGEASKNVDVSDNPLLQVVKGIEISGKPVRANDLFRVVHDYFGHIMEGVGFRATGEENAWRIHSAMFSPLARRAMTTETRGQNSWVNFGPFGEKNRTAGPEDTEYAPQKIGLLPDWVVNEGADDRTLNQDAALAGWEGVSQYLTDEEKDAVRERTKDRILELVELLPEAEEMAAAASAGRAKRGWYERSAQAILDVFGAADAPRFAMLLAAMSPQTSVEQNLFNALRTWTEWNNAGRPKERATIVEIMGRAVQGKKGTGSILTAWINNSFAALTTESFEGFKLSGPKVDSFANNLVGAVDEVTNDTWMAMYAGLDSMSAGGRKGKPPLYKAMNAVVRRAAEILTERTGETWTPAEVQETVWSFAKTLYEKRDMAGGRQTMRQLLEAGGVTHGDIANTPDFAVLFADGIFRTILSKGGYGQQAAALEGRGQPAPVDGSASVTSAEGTGFSESDFRKFLDQAAHRLEAVRQRRREEELRRRSNPDQRELFQDVMTSLPNGSTDPIGQRIAAFHGTPFDFDRFAPGKAVWFSEGRDLAKRYADPRRFRKAGEGRVIEAELTIMAPLDLDPVLAKLPSHRVIENPVAWAKEQFGFDLPAHGWERTGQDYDHTIFRSQAFADAAREAGYDAIKVTEGGATTWGMLREGAIHTADGRQLFQALSETPEAIFYSAAERAVENAPQQKASAQQWKALLTPGKTPGIKSEEIEWTGIHDWLDMQKGQIDKDALLHVLRDRAITVDEVVLGRPLAEVAAEFGMTEESEDYEMLEYDREIAAQFRVYSSDPSNETYRELLITLPQGVGSNPERSPSTHWDTEGVVAHVRFMEKQDAEGKRVLFIEEVQSDWHQKGRDQGYEQIADAETKKRIDEASAKLREVENDISANKAALIKVEKSLNKQAAPLLLRAYDIAVREVEEQSKQPDSKITPEAVDVFKNVMKTQMGVNFFRHYEERGDQAGYVGWGDLRGWLSQAKTTLERNGEQPPADMEAQITEVERLQTEQRQLHEELNLRGRELDVARGDSQRGIPEAPFKSSWPALVMKRAIRWAVDNGFDKVAWTTGEEQAQRYNLSQAVGTVYARRDPAYPDSVLIDFANKDALGTLREAAGAQYHYDSVILSNEQVLEHFGRDLGQRILDTAPEGDTYRAMGGEDLKLGGEGMKAFYDRNLVNITNDIIKKYGVKVGPTNVLVDPNSEPGPFAKYVGEHPGFEISDKLREAASSGFALFQRQPEGPRGMTTFTDDGRRLIQLFGAADRSTLLHETGHIWLEELKADAFANDATDQDKKDWETVSKWFASNGAPLGKNGFIPTPAHELWARGIERYFMEGKAPTIGLRGVFKTFRSWLLRIYGVAQNLNSPITPEVREVMDRLIATQDAIDEARRNNDTEPLFKSAEEAGMTETEFADYQQRIADARDEAYDALLFKTMEKIRRERTAEMRDRKAAIRSELMQQINSQPQFRLLHLLRTGRWLGEPEREAVKVKLNTGWLIDNFGEDVLNKLPRGIQIFAGNGETGDVVAEMVGMASGSEVVHALLGMRAASDALRDRGETRSMRDVMVSEETDRIMAERYGDTLTDGSIEEEAIAALNAARQGEIIGSEIRQLTKRKNILGVPTPYQFAREWARRTVSAGHVRDVASRSALQRYTRAANKAARLAEEAILKSDVDEAYRQKQAQLLNHALLAEAKAAADRIDKIVARLKKLGGRAAMKSVHPDYMDKVHALLENYDFRPRSQRSIDEQKDFETWLEKQREQGFEVHVPPRLENRGEPYTRVSVQELESLGDLVDSLIAVGRTKQKLKVAQEERDFNEVVDEIAARIEQLPNRKMSRVRWVNGIPRRETNAPVNEPARKGAGLAAELVKVETIAEELDGGPAGPLHDILVVGATAAENLRHELRERVLIPIAQMYHSLGRKHWRRLQERVTIPELTWNTLNEGDPRLGSPVTVTRMELLSIFMNMGNLSNLEKLSKGERWPVETLRRVMDRELTKEDYDLAQRLWDQVGLLWPDIVRTEQEMSGVVPEKVVNSPISTKFGDYAGGYWPVVYDANRWQKAEDLEGAAIDDMFGIKSGVATQKGHTVTRTQAFGPINLNLENVLFRHIEQVVTRIAFAPFARDTLRIVRNTTIRGLIDTKLGSEYRKQIEPWLARQIHEGHPFPKGARWWDSLLRGFRINMTIAAMGFRLSTGAAQMLGLTASAQRIGGYWVGVGLKRLAFAPRAAAAFAYSKSPELLHRTEAVNREVAEVARKMRGRHRIWSEAQHWAMWHIGMIDRYLVSVPTWLGAYEKSLSEGMTDEQAVAYADKSVRMSQGTGREKDMAAVQSPNSEAMRFFTMFYTPFNVMFNAQWQGVRGLKRGKIRPMIAVTWWWMIASMLGDALMSGDWPEEWDDPEAIGSWFSRNVFFGMFAGIPLARDMANYAERKSIGQYTSDPGTTPITRVGDAIQKAWNMGKHVAKGEEVQRPIKQSGDLTAIMLGVPTSQIGTSAQFAWDVHEGEQDPKSVSDWYFGITQGKVPKHEEEAPQ